MSPGLAGTCRFDNVLNIIEAELVGPYGAGDYRLEVVETPVGRGLRRYFVCPICRRDCVDLILIDDPKCRACYRERPSPFSKRHRDALLLEAEQFVEGMQYRVAKSCPDLPLAVRDPKSSPAPAEVFEAHGGPSDLTTKTALNRGRGMGQWEIYYDYLSLDYDAVMNLPGLPDQDPISTIGRLDEFPALNLRAVRKHLATAAGQVSALCLEYGSRPDQIPIGLFEDLRFAEPVFVVAHRLYDCANPGWQRLKSHRHSSNRLYFICPVLGVPSDTLYLRNGLFASRKAQRLVHPTQRVAKRRG